MIDQPFMNLQLYKNLIDFVDNDNLIFQPALKLGKRKKPGHPLIFSPRFKQELMKHSNKTNLRDVMRYYEDKRKYYYTEDDTIFMNLNTPEDVSKLISME